MRFAKLAIFGNFAFQLARLQRARALARAWPGRPGQPAAVEDLINATQCGRRCATPSSEKVKTWSLRHLALFSVTITPYLPKIKLSDCHV